MTANAGFGGVLDLFFSSQDIFSDNFTGNVVGFFPTSVSGVSLANGAHNGGLLIDNTVDSSDPISLFYVSPNLLPGVSSNSIPGQTIHPNRSTFVSPTGPLVIGSVAAVPEPSSLLLSVICLTCLLLNMQAPSE